MTMQRFPALSPSDLTPAQRQVYDQIAAGPRGGVRGPFIALLHNPALAQQVQSLGEHLRYKTGLPDSLVELAILVVARHWNCAYEWYAHEKLARKAGLDAHIIAAINEGRDPSPVSPMQELVHAFCAEALLHGAASDASFEKAAEAFGRAAVLDLLGLCGYYTLLALVLNTARLEVPTDDGPPLAPRSSGSDIPGA